MTDDPLDLNALEQPRGVGLPRFTIPIVFVKMNKHRWGDDAPDHVQKLIAEAETMADAAVRFMVKKDMANAAAYRSAAMLKLTELDNLWSQRNKSESVREANRKRRASTAEQVLTLRNQYLADGKEPRSIAGLIANKLNITPQYVRRILKNK